MTPALDSLPSADAWPVPDPRRAVLQLFTTGATATTGTPGAPGTPGLVRGTWPAARRRPGRTTAEGGRGARPGHRRPARPRPRPLGLLVVPPDTTEDAAEPIMTAVLGDRA
ncbi:hypothetical protein [Streptomyces sp. AK010]|uniref:hypothetical protein n=1 Tax=Streptomyces sp. AK010 TaxID=2723074 RepID=UPI001800C3A8|nr:hypothetical protein [Streptomyces sp. AK010]MBB6416166.1 hypothetical protein [Streptomyces sp. AK010]